MQQTRGLVVAVALATLLTGTSTAQARGEVELKAGAEATSTLGSGVRCGDTITQHTKLTRDLACPGTNGPALRVVGVGIVLDLGGYTVSRTGPEMGESEGIVVDANSMVRNGTIRGFRWGVLVDGAATAIRLHRLALVDNGTAIYHRIGNARLLITDSRLSGNGDGLSSEFATAFGEYDIRSTHFTGNGRAIFVDAHDTDVLDSTFTSNGTVVYCFYGSVRFRSSTIAQNTAVGTMPFDTAGFLSCGEMRIEDTLIANNTSFAPPTAPVWEPYSLVLRNSWVVNNGSGLRGAARTVFIEGNTFWDNAGGLTLADLPEVVPVPLTGIVRDNRFLRNDGDGLRVLPPSMPTLIGNVALGNTGWGIHAPTANDGGGNVARDNGAGDCVGVVCADY
ncbi:right-handed parallel beta-helix repeat-containing protein [Pyxidicoccus fallax]|uniref:Right-handed parallel beta-helix repeat-containing protein n=1 Tax=Pyxidicoccus fallax TaxID=394095 RepID=A0A848LLS9_9BACT|nr:right-handed parallel beta-helix repeat-containing protein [Pyxidicoccus fallax]NMO18718.1 right-handed parallel beta-helix repeat-containing protein [Pyxidicoccus fallax]NPC79299.1 right-handed parallel beta-helix repeat-containing protein [Pyxidicoccus fallax]